jgi:type III secretory pathway component EscS
MNIIYASIIVTIIIFIAATQITDNYTKLFIYLFITVFTSFQLFKTYSMDSSPISDYNNIFAELEDGKMYNKFLTTPFNPTSTIEGGSDELIIDNIPPINIVE